MGYRLPNKGGNQPTGGRLPLPAGTVQHGLQEGQKFGFAGKCSGKSIRIGHGFIHCGFASFLYGFLFPKAAAFWTNKKARTMGTHSPKAVVPSFSPCVGCCAAPAVLHKAQRIRGVIDPVPVPGRNCLLERMRFKAYRVEEDCVIILETYSKRQHPRNVWHIQTAEFE